MSRLLRRRGVLVVGVVVLAVGCTGDSGEAGPASPDTSSRSTEDTTAASTDALGVDPDDELAYDGASMAVSPAAVRSGDELTVTIECPNVFRSTAKATFGNPAPNAELYLGAAWQLDETSIDAEARYFEGTITVPYWLEPGTATIVGSCTSPILPPSPATLEVLPPEQGRWDSWRPLQGPWIAEPIPDGAFEQDGTWEYAITDGDRVEVAALCDPDVEVEGARFVLWQRYLTPDSVDRHDAFFALEFPARSQTDTPEGAVIATTISIDLGEIPDPADLRSGLAVTALCTSTPTPFEADAELGPEPEGGITPLYLPFT